MMVDDVFSVYSRRQEKCARISDLLAEDKRLGEIQFDDTLPFQPTLRDKSRGSIRSPVEISLNQMRANELSGHDSFHGVEPR
jgi:hypothetical protein